jgi:hypothetical protein
MRVIPRSRLKVLLLALVVGLATAGAAAPAVGHDVKPFSYSFVVTSVTANGIFTINGATSTIHVHLTAPTKKIQLVWLGKHAAGSSNGCGSAQITFTGQASFVDPTLPSCNKTFPITSAGSSPGVGITLANARNRVVTHPTFYVLVGRFPMITGAPSTDGVCGRVRKDWWETAHGSFPFPAIVKKKAFVLRDARPLEDIGDGESVEWTLEMHVRKVRFIPISCKKAKGC